jgi:hypothetical protein
VTNTNVVPVSRWCAANRRGAPFWIHGDEGTICGRVRFDDFVQIERGGSVQRYEGLGDWFTVGFGGAMCELLSAIVDGRAPSNSARSHLPALELIAAACESAGLDGAARRVSWTVASTTT